MRIIEGTNTISDSKQRYEISPLKREIWYLDLRTPGGARLQVQARKLGRDSAGPTYPILPFAGERCQKYFAAFSNLPIKLLLYGHISAVLNLLSREGPGIVGRRNRQPVLGGASRIDWVPVAVTVVTTGSFSSPGPSWPKLSTVERGCSTRKPFTLSVLESPLVSPFPPLG